MTDLVMVSAHSSIHHLTSIHRYLYLAYWHCADIYGHNIIRITFARRANEVNHVSAASQFYEACCHPFQGHVGRLESLGKAQFPHERLLPMEPIYSPRYGYAALATPI